MVSSLPFLVVLVMCTGLARLDFGIVKSCLDCAVRYFWKFWVFELFDIQMVRLSGRQDFKICLARTLRQICIACVAFSSFDCMIYIGHLL